MISLEGSSRYKLLNNIPWGAHFCLFYESEDDLIDILVPYFKAGLENNEYCMWVTSEPLNKREAEIAIQKAIPEFDKYLKRKQIEIISYTEWYMLNNEFDSDRVLNGWVDKCNLAQENGFEGLRLTGNTFWLEKKDWNDFRDYEEEINRVIGNYQMKAICTYSLEKCGPFELLDVIKNHQFALIRRDGNWESFKSMEQIELERKLKESEEKWRALSENSPAHVLLLDREHKIIFINRTVPDLLKEEVIGTSVYDYTPQEFHKTKKDCFNLVWETGEPSPFSQYYKTKEGDIRYFDIWVGPVFQSGKVVALVSHSLDITERKKKEAELQLQSEIIENMSEGVYLIKLNDGTIAFTNPAFEEMFGYNPGEIIGKNVAIVNAPTEKTPEETREEIMGILKEAGEWHGEVLNIKKDGTPFWCYANVSLFEHSDYGTVIVSVHTDITERKKIEQDLKESEEILKATLESTVDGILVVNEKGQVSHTNSKFADMWRIPQDLITERDDQKLLDYVLNQLKDPEVFLSKVNQLYRSASEDFDTLYFKDGRIFERHSSPLIRDGEINGRIWSFRDVTERKRAEQKLRESEERFNKAFHSSPNAIAITRMEDGKIIDVNEGFVRSYGYSYEELIGKSTLNLNLWVNSNERDKFIKSLKENKKIKDFEVLIRTKSDQILIMLFSGEIFRLDNESQLITIATDITERKKAEEALKESEERYRTIINFLGDPMHVIDRNYKIILINETLRKWVKNLNLDTELIGKTPKEAWSFLPDWIMEEYHSIFNSGNPKMTIGSLIINNKKITTETRKIPIFKKGKVIQIITLIRDITESKKAEKELRISEENYRNLINNIQDVIAEIDTEGKITYASPQITSLLGYQLEEIIGKNYISYVHPEDISLVLNAMKKTMESVILSGIEFRMKHKKGNYVFISGRGKMINFDGDQKFLGILSDISERKRADTKLKESEEKFRLIAEQTLIGISIIQNEDLKYLNRAFGEMHEYTVEEMYEMTLNDLINKIHREDVHLVREGKILRETGDKSIHHFVFRIKTKSGKIKWLDNTSIGIQYNGREALLSTVIDITELKEIEKKLNESKHELDERVKELTCLYEISKLIEDPTIFLDDILNGTLILIPPAMQFPDIATARITYDGREYRLGNFEETEWDLSTKVEINEKILFIEVVYLKNKSFLKEEQDLIREIGIRLKVTLEEKEAQNKLRESEEKYRIGFKSSTDGIASADMEGNFVDFNNTFIEMLGYSREELFKLNFREITPKKWQEMEDNIIISQLADGKGSGIYEKEYIRKDGTVFPVDVRFWIIKDEQGDPDSMWSIVRDITERKKAEEKITDLAKFPSENPHPVLRLDRNKVIYVNSSGRSLLNVEIGEEIPSIIQEEVNKVFETNSMIEFDIELKDKIYSFAITPIENQNYINLYGMDITERKKAEEKIIDLAKFPSENPHPILRLNMSKVLYVNNSGNYLLDVKEGDEIPSIIQQEVRKAFDRNSVIDLDIELKDRIYSFTITPFIKKNYVNLYGMDITENKQAERKLEEINQLKSEFLRRASHELKTPLISIKGFSDLILALHKDQISSDIISKLNEINQGCERLQSIINNLLKTSRLESPDLKPKAQREDLSFLIKFCVHELQSLLQARNQTLDLNITDGQYGLFEKEEIHDVFSNLLTNAIKYTPPKGKISINTEEKGDFVMISVKDDGIGFTEEQEGRIFKQFGKIERYGQGLDLGIGGTGLGLYISKRIVESHGGEIWMESEGKNKGSTFYFTIPLSKA